jgi:hypothetical protein
MKHMYFITGFLLSCSTVTYSGEEIEKTIDELCNEIKKTGYSYLQNHNLLDEEEKEYIIFNDKLKITFCSKNTPFDQVYISIGMEDWWWNSKKDHLNGLKEFLQNLQNWKKEHGDCFATKNRYLDFLKSWRPK